jgi:lipoprotein-releasing system permease protein
VPVVVLSVMNGFERELRTRMLTVTSHATLMGLEGALPDRRTAASIAQRTPGVIGVSPYVESQAMFANGNRVVGASLRGIDARAEARAGGLGVRVQGASFDALQGGRWRVVLGAALARDLGVGIGESVGVDPARGQCDARGDRAAHASTDRDRHVRIGDVRIRSRACVHRHRGCRSAAKSVTPSPVRLTLADPLRAPSIVREVALALGGGYYVSDWTRNHANFFARSNSPKVRRS